MQTRLEIILETVQSILESTPKRRRTTKMGKTMAVSAGETRYTGSPSERGNVWDDLPEEEKTRIKGLVKFGELKREAKKNK